MEASFTPRSLYHGKDNPCALWIGDWVGPRAGLDDMEKWKLLTLPGLEVQYVVSNYTDCPTPPNALKCNCGYIE
jgi:hypothetical protein